MASPAEGVTNAPASGQNASPSTTGRGKGDEHIRDPTEKAWQSPKELEATAERSKEVAGTEFPDDIAWIRSYVIKEEGGTLGTICIYQASSVDKVREHAKRVDMPADEVLEIADTVIVRPTRSRRPPKGLT